MDFHFVEYTAAELAECREAFLATAAAARQLSTRDATRFVLDWFRIAAGPGTRVFPDARFGELLVDQCHVTYPERPPGESGLAFWDRAHSEPFRMRLALESEWGRYGSLHESLVRVLDDAQKLAFVRADVKVILFASYDGRECEQFVRRIQMVRACTADSANWLWLDVPWHCDQHAASAGVLAA